MLSIIATLSENPPDGSAGAVRTTNWAIDILSAWRTRRTIYSGFPSTDGEDLIEQWPWPEDLAEWRAPLTDPWEERRMSCLVAGWPMRAVRATMTQMNDIDLNAEAVTADGGLLVRDGAIGPWVVPLRPIPLGLAVDIAAWAGAFHLVQTVAVAVRSRRRRRDGRCVECGHIVAGSGGACPECGG